MPVTRQPVPASDGHSKPPFGLLAAMVATLLLAACGQIERPKAAKSEPARPVLVQTVRFEPSAERRTFVGTIRPRIESDLGFRVAGKVARRLVDVGDSVRTGQMLALLDETDLRLQQEQAKAELDAARLALASADAELDRRSQLNAKGYTTQTALDQQRATVADAKGRVMKAERALALADNALGYATLGADAEGVVTQRLIEPGQVVAAGQTAIRVARTAEREVMVAIPEHLVETIRTGTAAAALWAQPDRAYRAVLRELSPAADPQTRTYAARFSLPTAGTEAAFGMTANISVSAGSGETRVARLPLSALYNDGKGPAVWVVDRMSGALTLKLVEVERYESAAVTVSKGLADGDEVVTLGVQKLDAGQKVRVVTALGQ